MTRIQENLILVYTRLIELVKEDEGLAEHLAYSLESDLDEVAMDDGFGTERQCDPRGDMRVKEWSLTGEVQQ
ncbi:hypothetical protein 16Q_102 [Pseudomonas phage 16Q]|nr:hypothetical protein 16Q_102 [Pseudomonas phage 16Q]